METINSDRLMFALSQLSKEDGFLFERFANAFLASEIDGLRPVGGVHDAGRDAFISTGIDEPTAFCPVISPIRLEEKNRRHMRDT